MYEAATKATEWDTYAQTGQEHPQWDDTPDSCGDTYYLGGLISTSISDFNSGIPSVDFSISQNPIVSTSMVNFTLPASAQATIEVLDLTGRIDFPIRSTVPVSGIARINPVNVVSMTVIAVSVTALTALTAIAGFFWDCAVLLSDPRTVDVGSWSD